MPVERDIMHETKAIEKKRPATEQEKQHVNSASCLVGGVGVCLCLTGVGAILGVPILLGALWGNKAEKKKLLHVWEAPCPFCGTPLSVPVNTLGSNCPACRKRFVLRGNNFVGIE